MKATSLAARLPLALGAFFLIALTGCVGYVDGGYDGGAVVVAQPDVFLYGGGGYNGGGDYDHGHDVHNYSQRGAVSRGGSAGHGGGGGHPASGGHDGGGGGHGGGGDKH